jgi:hypothetical protein
MAQLFGTILLLDGLVTAIWGRRFLWWQRKHVPDWYKLGLDALIDWPEPWLRGAAAAEALLGAWWLLSRSRVQRAGQ